MTNCNVQLRSKWRELRFHKNSVLSTLSRLRVQLFRVSRLGWTLLQIDFTVNTNSWELGHWRRAVAGRPCVVWSGVCWTVWWSWRSVYVCVSEDVISWRLQVSDTLTWREGGLYYSGSTLLNTLLVRIHWKGYHFTFYLFWRDLTLHLTSYNN